MESYIDLKTRWICQQMAPALDAALSKMTLFEPPGHICLIDENDKEGHVHFDVHLKPGAVCNLSRENIRSMNSKFFGKSNSMHAVFIHGSNENVAVADDDVLPQPNLPTVDVFNNDTKVESFLLNFEFDSKCHFTLVLHLKSKNIVVTDLQHNEFQFVLEPKNSKGYFFKICKKEQISFGAPEEQPVCYELVGANLQRTELSVITIRDRKTYFHEIFIRNLSGVAPEETIKYIRLGNYIFKVDLADFYIYGIKAVVADKKHIQWPWKDNDGNRIQPPFNGDDVVKYMDLFKDCSADTNRRFALAFNKGDFTDPQLNSNSKRESQALLALLYSEAVRNFETLEYNKEITEHIEYLHTLLNGIFLHLVHPMACQGTFENKKTTVTGNKKAKKNWEECKIILSFLKRLFSVLRRLRTHIL